MNYDTWKTTEPFDPYDSPDPRDEDDRAHDLAAQDFVAFVQNELRKNEPWGHPASLLLAMVHCCYTLQDERFQRETWDPIACAIFDAVDTFGWGGMLALVAHGLAEQEG